MLPDATKLMKRARRTARSVKNGPQIMRRLEEPDARGLLVEGAEEGIPSVSKVAPILLGEFNTTEIKLAPVKTLIGLCVRAILAEEGYERIERGVRTDADDELFSTGSVYAKADVDDAELEIDGIDELIELLATVSEKLLPAPARKRLTARLELLD